MEPIFDDDVVERSYSPEIRIAVRLLANTIPAGGEDVAAICRAGVGEWELAVRLAAFVPICAGREMLMMTGMFLPPDYLLWDEETGESTSHRFRDDPLYRQIQEHLPALMKDVTQRQLQNLLDRSPEVNALKQMPKGSHPGNMMLAPPIVLLSCPPVEEYELPPARQRRRPKRRVRGWLFVVILAAATSAVVGLIATALWVNSLQWARRGGRAARNERPRIVTRPAGPAKLYRRGQPIEPGMIAQLPFGNRLRDVLIVRLVDAQRVEIGWIGFTSRWNEVVPIARLHEKPEATARQ
jgi:hypothetical protein